MASVGIKSLVCNLNLFSSKQILPPLAMTSYPCGQLNWPQAFDPIACPNGDQRVARRWDPSMWALIPTICESILMIGSVSIIIMRATMVLLVVLIESS